MTTLLAKTFHPRFRGQGNEVVGNCQNRPVCLDAPPGSHKHFPEAQVLLDVLVEDLDGEALKIDSHHLGFGHIEFVGDKKARFPTLPVDEQFHPSNLRQPDDLRGYPEPFLFGNSNHSVRKPPLGQKTDSDLDLVPIDVTVLFQSRQKDPACFLNGIENRGTGIPRVHDDRETSRKQKESFVENLQGKGHFAFEVPRFRSFLGGVSPQSKDEIPCPGFDQSRHCTKAFDEAMRGMMETESLDMSSISGYQRIVENQKSILSTLHHDLTECLYFFLKLGNKAWGVLQKVMKAIGIALAEMGRYFPDRTELHKPDQSDQVGQKIFSLRPVENSQEFGKIRRYFLGCFCAHGFRALLGLVSIGDFGRKPFYLKYLSCLFA